MGNSPIQPGKTLENFQSLIHGPEAEESTPLIPSENTERPADPSKSEYLPQNAKNKNLTETTPRQIPGIFRTKQ